MAIAVVFVFLALLLELIKLVRPKFLSTLRSNIGLHYFGNMLRLYLLAYFALLATSFNQLQIENAPWYLMALSISCIVVFVFAATTFIAIQVLKVKPYRTLFEAKTYLLKYGPLYNMYRSNTYRFFLLYFFYKIGTSAAVGLAGDNAVTQMGILIALELCLFALVAYIYPFKDKFSNRLNIFISVMRLLSVSTLVAFIAEVQVPLTTKKLIGLGALLLHAIVFLCFFVLMLRNLLKLVILGVQNRGRKDVEDTNNFTAVVVETNARLPQIYLIADDKSESQIVQSPWKRLSMQTRSNYT